MLKKNRNSNHQDTIIMAVTKSSGDEILDGHLEHSIKLYLREGEDREALLKQFKGNKTLLVMFFREREFEQYIGSTYTPDIKNAERIWKEESIRIAEARAKDLIKYAAMPIKKKRGRK